MEGWLVELVSKGLTLGVDICVSQMASIVDYNEKKKIYIYNLLLKIKQRHIFNYTLQYCVRSSCVLWFLRREKQRII